MSTLLVPPWRFFDVIVKKAALRKHAQLDGQILHHSIVESKVTGKGWL